MKNTGEDMAKEWLDIVDTAVKIGLGALISGIATYAVTKGNNKYDKEKVALERNIKLIHDFAESLELAGKCTNFYTMNSVKLIENNFENFDEMRGQIRDSILEGLSSVSSMRSTANLIGCNSLFNLSENYISKLSDLSNLIFTMNDYRNFVADSEKKMQEIREIRKSIYNRLSEVYKLTSEGAAN